MPWSMGSPWRLLKEGASCYACSCWRLMEQTWVDRHSSKWLRCCAASRWTAFRMLWMHRFMIHGSFTASSGHASTSQELVVYLDTA